MDVNLYQVLRTLNIMVIKLFGFTVLPTNISHIKAIYNQSLPLQDLFAKRLVDVRGDL